MSPCSPVTLTIDPSINGLYVTCVEKIPYSGGRYRYRIRKKTFDGNIDNVIYSATQGKAQCHCLGLGYLYFYR